MNVYRLEIDCGAFKCTAKEMPEDALVGVLEICLRHIGASSERTGIIIEKTEIVITRLM